MDFKKNISQLDKNSASRIILNLLAEKGYANIIDFQKKNKLVADGFFGGKSFSILYDILLKPIYASNFYEFFRDKFPKKQIVWHHTEGHDNVNGVVDWWKNDGRQNIATSALIGKAGNFVQVFDNDFWAYSLGIKSNAYKNGFNGADKTCVAVELTNSGGLIKKGNDYISNFNSKVTDVVNVDFRGYKYYDRYTDKQIQALKYWTLLCAAAYDIPLDYEYDNLFVKNNNALGGKSGIYTHCSFRDSDEKQDLSPQPALINMAKNLINYTK